jgi:uncharacterized protein
MNHTKSGDSRHPFPFHAIEGKGTYLIFNFIDISLFKVDPNTYELFSQLIEGRTIEDLLSKNSYDEMQGIFRIINHESSGALKSQFSQECCLALDKLVLNVSNTCNLHCKYCYAAGGTYGEDRAFMDKHTATAAINYFYNIFDKINIIQFFGGEPFLNPKIIEHVCSHALDVAGKVPKFSIVSNGTIISPAIIQILSEYDIRATISIDGPKYINDQLRGKGTSGRIFRNISCLKKNNIDVSVESTFTGYHLNNGIKVSDLMKFFYKKFDIRFAHMPSVAASQEDDLHLDQSDLLNIYSEAMEYSLDSLSSDDYKVDSYTLRLIMALIQKNSIGLYCPAGVTSLSVSTKGDIYPCFMFIGKKEFRLGNVLEEKIDLSQLSYVSNLLKRVNKWTDCECSNCWAISLCFGCLGGDYVTTGSTDGRPNCNFMRQFLENFLLKFAESINDPVVLSRMISICQ